MEYWLNLFTVTWVIRLVLNDVQGCKVSVESDKSIRVCWIPWKCCTERCSCGFVSFSWWPKKFRKSKKILRLKLEICELQQLTRNKLSRKDMKIILADLGWEFQNETVNLRHYFFLHLHSWTAGMMSKQWLSVNLCLKSTLCYYFFYQLK